MTIRHALFLLAVLATAAFTLASLLQNRNLPSGTIDSRSTGPVQTPSIQSLVRMHSPVLGPQNARVTLVEFVDPACEACATFHDAVKQALAEHPRDLRVVLRYTPFHREMSVQGVRALEAARVQGRFQEVLQALFAKQDIWASHTKPQPNRAWEIAASAGLDLAKAQQHVATGAADRILQLDMQDVNAIGVEGTPTFYLNGQILPKISPERLKDRIQVEVSRLPASK